ncbi:hypothetical protein [Rossellomorea sp. LjRoot5]|uniref:hypothetical protein n=1 Tax=Rossellomorea sp. LjRoot5 TaxID=3342331 RepID=UPI003ECE9080
MKFIFSMYAVMALMVVVNLISEYLLNGGYSAIASWVVTVLFFFGTLFFINARYVFSKKRDER